MLPAIEEELQGLQGSIGCCHQVTRSHQVEVTRPSQLSSGVMWYSKLSR